MDRAAGQAGAQARLLPALLVDVRNRSSSPRARIRSGLLVRLCPDQLAPAAGRGPDHLRVRPPRQAGSPPPLHDQPDGRTAFQDLARPAARRHCHRGQRLLQARRGQLLLHLPGGMGRPDSPPDRAGRIDHHPAICEDRLHGWGTDLQAEDQGSHPGGEAGPQVLEEPDPREVPEHHLLRQRSVRGRGGRPDLLGDRHEKPGPRAVGHAGGPDLRAGPLRSGQQSRRLQVPPEHRPGPDGPARLHHPGPGRTVQVTADRREEASPDLRDLEVRLLREHDHQGARREVRIRGDVFRWPPRDHISGLSMQRAAEKAVAQHLPNPKDPAAALVAIDPRNGQILALVGGRDFNKVKFNNATQAKRQAGSAFKTFTLTGAFEQRINPKSVMNGPPEIDIMDPRCKNPDGTDWKPHNFADESGGTMNLIQATAHSVNTIFAQLVVSVGPDHVVDVAHRMGIRTRLDPVCSITLGSQDVTPLDMADAYATLAARGVHHDPLAITEVKSAGGDVLDRPKSESDAAVAENDADLVTYALQQVVLSGTGTAARLSDRPSAGKTGTTQDFRDAWFCGYVPQLTTCVWLGYQKSQRPMHNVEGVPNVFGGSIPAQIWNDFMTRALANVPPRNFPTPNFAGYDKKPQGAVSPTPSPSPSPSPKPPITTPPPPTIPPPPSLSPSPPPSPTGSPGQSPSPGVEAFPAGEPDVPRPRRWV